MKIRPMKFGFAFARVIAEDGYGLRTISGQKS
jgi:hypothetical protein